jgi:hypothetical protein
VRVQTEVTAITAIEPQERPTGRLAFSDEDSRPFGA